MSESSDALLNRTLVELEEVKRELAKVQRELEEVKRELAAVKDREAPLSPNVVFFPGDKDLQDLLGNQFDAFPKVKGMPQYYEFLPVHLFDPSSLTTTQGDKTDFIIGIRKPTNKATPDDTNSDTE